MGKLIAGGILTLIGVSGVFYSFVFVGAQGAYGAGRAAGGILALLIGVFLLVDGFRNLESSAKPKKRKKRRRPALPFDDDRPRKKSRRDDDSDLDE